MIAHRDSRVPGARGWGRSGSIWSGRQLWLRAAALLVLAGLLDAVVTYLLGASHDGVAAPRHSLPTAVGGALPEKMILAAMLPILGLVARGVPVRRLGEPRLLLVHLPVVAAFAIVHAALSIGTSSLLLGGAGVPDAAFRSALFRRLPDTFVFDLLLFAAIIAAFYAFGYYEKWQQQASASARLEASLARAHLDALRAQLDPHFLFNALNVISGMALRRDPERAASLIADLSRLLRRSLQIPTATVRLREELDFLRAYASIEQARVGERLRIRISADPEILDARVPSLLIQPLIENAIRHGLSRTTEPGEVRVDVERHHGRLRIRVRDTGVGFPRLDDGSVDPEEGVGLTNTRARLDHLYGDEAALTLSNLSSGGAQVRVDLPLQWWSVPPDEPPPRPPLHPQV